MIDRKRKIVKARGRGERERKSDHECPQTPDSPSKVLGDEFIII